MYFLFNIMTWLKIKTVKESSLITLFSFWPTPRISWFIKMISLNLSFCVWWCSLNYWICNKNKISFEIFLFNFFFLFAKLYKFKRYLYFLHLFCLTLFFKYCELIAINICIPFCSSSFLVLFWTRKACYTVDCKSPIDAYVCSLREGGVDYQMRQ